MRYPYLNFRSWWTLLGLISLHCQNDSRDFLPIRGKNLPVRAAYARYSFLNLWNIIVSSLMTRWCQIG